MTFNGSLQISAKVLSNILSPPAVTAALGFFVAFQEQPFWSGFARAVLYGVLISVLPLILVIYFLKTGRIQDLHISFSPRQRRIPYLAGFLGALAAFLILYAWGGSPLLTTLAGCNIIGLAALGLINNLWLVSNHTASAMMVASFSAYSFGPKSAIICLPLVGLVVWSRWLLQKHTIAQLAVGLLVGAAPVILFASMGWIPPQG